MRHYKARQRTDGKWDYTSRVDEWISAVGYCCEYRDLTIDESWLPREDPWRQRAIEEYELTYGQFKQKYHTHGHDTPEDAESCYKEYLLDTHLRFFPVLEHKATQLFRCRECNKWTASYAEILGEMKRYHLCEKHLNRDTVENLFSVGESWRS